MIPSGKANHTLLFIYLVSIAYGIPIALGLSWFPLPFLPYHQGAAITPASLLGYDNFSFPHVDWPWRIVAAHLLKGGELPLWNPYSSLGLPFPAQYQNQLFFPLEWLEIQCGPLGWNIFLVLKILVAGSGAWLVMRRMVPDQTACLIAATVYAFSSYFLWFQSITAFVNGALLVPWVFWASIQLLDETLPWPRRCGTLGLFLGLILLSGQPQLSVLTLMAAGLFIGVAALFSAGNPVYRAGTTILLFAAAALLGIGISAVQLLLFSEIITHGYSLHTAGAYTSAATKPLNFLLTIWPFLLGQMMSPWDGSLFPNRINPEGFPFVIGTAGLFLGTAGTIGIITAIAQRHSRPELKPPAILLAFLLVLAAGLGVILAGMLGPCLSG